MTTLNSLTDCKLLKAQAGQEVGQEVGGDKSKDESKLYALNKGYFNKRTKFKIATASQKDSQQVRVDHVMCM